MNWEEDQDLYVGGVEFDAWSIRGSLLPTIQLGNGLLREKISRADSTILVVAKLLVESSVLVFKMGPAAKSTVGEFLYFVLISQKKAFLV